MDRPGHSEAAADLGRRPQLPPTDPPSPDRSRALGWHPLTVAPSHSPRPPELLLGAPLDRGRALRPLQSPRSGSSRPAGQPWTFPLGPGHFLLPCRRYSLIWAGGPAGTSQARPLAGHQFVSVPSALRVRRAPHWPWRAGVLGTEFGERPGRGFLVGSRRAGGSECGGS